MILFLFAAALAAADPPARLDLEALLAKPVLPGVIALLVDHTRDARGAARVTEALSHPDAAVRAVAARVAGVAPLPSAGSTVRRALESETDRSAAAEQLRAALFLTPPGDEMSLIPAARKHELVGLLAEALGDTRGPAALPLLDALREAGLAESHEAGFLASVTRQGREQLNVVAARALRTANVSRWSKVLALARQPGAEIAPGMLLAALSSPNPGLRAAVFWHLALTIAKGVPLSLALEAAVAATPEATSPDAADADAAFALVVLRRAQKGPQFGGDWGERVASFMVPNNANGRAEPIGGFLTKAEAHALGRRHLIHDLPERKVAKEAPAKPKAVDGGGYGGLLFTGGLPPGALRDILAVTGCTPAADLRVGGLVVFRPDGRPRQISVAIEDPCVEVARATLGLTLAPPGLIDPARPERPTVLIVPLDPGALECAEQPESSAVERVLDVPEVPDGDPGPEKVKAPRKLKNVAPWYPERAKVARREGPVVLEAIVTPSGCVRSARVLRSVAPDLDASAMIAVGQWRYTPTILRGKPVPVIMTVTVNFRLRSR